MVPSTREEGHIQKAIIGTRNRKKVKDKQSWMIERLSQEHHMIQRMLYSERMLRHHATTLLKLSHTGLQSMILNEEEIAVT
jgi:hypothetical protein